MLGANKKAGIVMVIEAIERQLAHYAYHIGQIVILVNKKR